MQVLLGQDLEDHRYRHDRHGVRGQAAKIHAEDDIGDVMGNDGESQAGGQCYAEQKLHAFGEMRSHRGRPPVGMDLNRERKERGRSAHRRYHQGLPNQVQPRDIPSGIRSADEIGDHESIGDAGDGEQCQGQCQRKTLPRHRRETGSIEFQGRSSPGGSRLDQDRDHIGQR